MSFFNFSEKDKLPKMIYLAPEEIEVGKSLRRELNEDSLNVLALSIRKNGLLQPLCVERCGSSNSFQEYKLVAGYRRYIACCTAKMRRIPCIVHQTQNCPDLINLIENLQRDDLTYFEQAYAIQQLRVDYSMTQREISERIGLSESAISNKLRLLRINEAQQHKIYAAGLSERHARAFLRICDDNARAKVIDSVISHGYNADETEKYIDRLLTPAEKRPTNKLVIKDLKLFVNSINKAINVMRISGINAKSRREEDDDYIKYTVVISKKINNITTAGVHRIAGENTH